MAEPAAFRLILASASPGRRELLSRLGLPFEVLPAAVEEPEEGFADPRSQVQAIAWMKAAAVVRQIEAGLVLAADTIGWVNGHPVLKPRDEDDARRILRELGGREHELWTGVVLWRRPDDLQLAWQECSRVFFKGLSDAELDRYLATRSWHGHSGAYAIEETDDPHVRVVAGSITNVIGLPLETLRKVLPILAPHGLGPGPS
jgi:septum formation protein